MIIMNTWLTLDTIFLLGCVLNAVRRLGEVLTISEWIACSLIVVLTAVPMIYAFGWLLLPSWGLSVVAGRI